MNDEMASDKIVSEAERLERFTQELESVATTHREVLPGVVVLLELGQQMSVALADPFALREQDLNARMMLPAMFQQFQQNVRRRGMLESLPYCALVEGAGGKLRVEIVSGHHRTRVARSLGKKSILIILDESRLTRSQIVAKQLAHNAIGGFDDNDMLRELMKLMDNVDDVLESGMGDQLDGVPEVGDMGGNLFQPKLRFDWQHLSFAFLPHQLHDLSALIDEVHAAKPDLVAAVNVEQFAAFVQALTKFGRTVQVKNTGATLALLTQIALDQVRALGGDPADRVAAEDTDGAAGEQPERWVPLAQVMGRATVPEHAAEIVRQALDRMEQAGEVQRLNRWQALELWAADYLSGAPGAWSEQGDEQEEPSHESHEQ